MKTRVLGILLVLVLFLAGLGMVSAEGLEHDILVLFTSDIHCGVDQNFGFVGLKAIKDAAIAAGNHVLLVDDGDAIQGESLGLLSKGEAIIDMMNQVGYDIAAIGNHEFDYGMDRFFELTEIADFPYICCNFRKNGEDVFLPYIIKEFDGIQVAFIGVSTPETRTSSTPKYFQDNHGNFIYSFLESEGGTEFYAAIQSAADSARAEGADYVIIMGHLGNSAASAPYTYADAVANTYGIDAVLDGHSHDTDKVVMKNKNGEAVVRQACGTKLECVGWLRISASDGKIDTGLYNWNNDISMPELFGYRNEVSETVDLYMEAVINTLADSVGSTPFDLTTNDPNSKDSSGNTVRIIRNAETNLGDLVADAFRVVAEADIGLVNGGGFRKSIPMGAITLKNCVDVFPFGNSVLKAEVTGQQILDALEFGVRVTPEEDGMFLQCSGLTYEINTDIESTVTMDNDGMFAGVSGERRVQNVKVGGEPIDPEKKYTVASDTYVLTDHGNGLTAFDGATILEECPLVDYEILAHYIVYHLDMMVGAEYENPYGQGRIVAVHTEK